MFVIIEHTSSRIEPHPAVTKNTINAFSLRSLRYITHLGLSIGPTFLLVGVSPLPHPILYFILLYIVSERSPTTSLQERGRPSNLIFAP